MISMEVRAAICVAVLLPVAAASLPAVADVVISTAATKNMSCSNGICAPTAESAILNVGDLESLLGSGNIEVTTTGFGVQAKNIRINGAFNWSASSTLTLDAYETIVVDEPVSDSGQGGLTIVTNDGGTGGVFLFGPKGHMTFANLSSALTINGTPYTLVTTLPALAGAIAANPSGAYSLANSYDAGQDGTYSAAPVSTTFTGSFNGLGNAISHVSIQGTTRNAYTGLFSYIDTAGTVSSLHVTKISISVKKDPVAGSLAGVNFGKLFNVFASGKVRAAAGSNGVVGGIVGSNDGGNIIGTATSVSVSVGSKGEPTIASVGGLVGINNGTVAESFATGAVAVEGSAQQSPCGGLVGFNSGSVENSYALGSASVEGIYAEVGGLIGDTASSISYSYSTGAPHKGQDGFVGGLLGYDRQQTGETIIDDYWDMTTSGIGKSRGAGNVPNDPGIKGKTTAQLQAGLPKGFDPKIWAQNPKINNGFPYLINNPPEK